jgi:DNA-binding CsgD family transcriptional regulator
MLEERSNPRGFDSPNDYAFMHNEKFCGAVPEGEGTYPHHCLHGASTEMHACCWCGDCFEPDTVATVHGDNFHPLTPREVQVVALVAAGLTNRIIGRRLKISLHTVHFHVEGIVSKLNAKNRAGAAAEAVRRGIIP